MSARDLVFASIRRALGVSGAEEPRRKAVQDRLRDHPRGVIPQRGQLGMIERIALFVSKVEAVSGTTQRIASIELSSRQHADLVPEHIRSKSLIQPPPVPAPPKRRGRPPRPASKSSARGWPSLSFGSVATVAFERDSPFACGCQQLAIT